MESCQIAADAIVPMLHPVIVDQKTKRGAKKRWSHGNFPFVDSRERRIKRCIKPSFFCPQEKQLGKEGGGVAFLHVQLQERAKGR
ncbi:hypothetical protein GGR02_003513 [Anoxybacillus voinovskiensis]|uniref:Uncharacterized protein n=1 Tax=Anoxybacteroides voinovskiense TaxID=230470 RepID=A0A840E1K7_9BACL|nr:hypothetical protein [Anoxybacillus voinovskiensis]MBB4075659.1 hypothetical protein [Anoxybacillus voinovskiensis]